MNASAVGLISDMIGASLLAYALVLNKDASIARYAATTWDHNPVIAREIVTNRYDARHGLAALLLGFFLQLDGVYGWHSDLIGLAGLCTSLLIAIHWWLFRSTTISIQTNRIVGKN